MPTFTAVLKDRTTYRIVADSLVHAWRELQRMGIEYLYVDSGQKKRHFHGGCSDCVAQTLHGLGYCDGCMFRSANWNLPDKSIKGNTQEAG